MGSTKQITTSRSSRRKRVPAQRRADRPKAGGAGGGARKPKAVKPRSTKPRSSQTLREVLDDLVPEWQLQADIINRLIFHHWLWHHTPDSAANRKPPRGVAQPCAGLQDIVAVRPPRVLFIETKTQKGRERTQQTLWREVLAQCPGVEVYLWRPTDWSSGRVEEVLR